MIKASKCPKIENILVVLIKSIATKADPGEVVMFRTTKRHGQAQSGGQNVVERKENMVITKSQSHKITNDFVTERLSE